MHAIIAQHIVHGTITVISDSLQIHENHSSIDAF
jgi:hypothetical protein